MITTIRWVHLGVGTAIAQPWFGSKSILIRLSIFFVNLVLKNLLLFKQLKHYYTRLPILTLLFYFLIYLYYFILFFHNSRNTTLKKNTTTLKKKSFLFPQLMNSSSSSWGSDCSSTTIFQWFGEVDGYCFCCLLPIFCCFRPNTQSDENALSSSTKFLIKQKIDERKNLFYPPTHNS